MSDYGDGQPPPMSFSTSASSASDSCLTEPEIDNENDHSPLLSIPISLCEGDDDKAAFARGLQLLSGAYATEKAMTPRIAEDVCTPRPALYTRKSYLTTTNVASPYFEDSPVIPLDDDDEGYEAESEEKTAKEKGNKLGTKERAGKSKRRAAKEKEMDVMPPLVEKPSVAHPLSPLASRPAPPPPSKSHLGPGSLIRAKRPTRIDLPPSCFHYPSAHTHPRPLPKSRSKTRFAESPLITPDPALDASSASNVPNAKPPRAMDNLPHAKSSVVAATGRNPKKPHLRPTIPLDLGTPSPMESLPSPFKFTPFPMKKELRAPPARLGSGVGLGLDMESACNGMTAEAFLLVASSGQKER